MNKQKTALIIFVRNPVLGKVKTRIAQTAGDEAALQIYRQLLQHTSAITTKVDADKFVFYSDKIEQEDNWENEIFNKQLQTGSSLGEKMSNAFQLLFNKGYNHIAIIGSDCYELTAEIINHALGSLNSFDTVIGPAKDGGYYLLGMNNFYPGLFTVKNWSTETVAAETIQLITRHNISSYQLPLLSDIDTEEDWRTAKNENNHR
jgi:rSAM/selenodomain-associated transferase 1